MLCLTGKVLVSIHYNLSGMYGITVNAERQRSLVLSPEIQHRHLVASCRTIKLTLISSQSKRPKQSFQTQQRILFLYFKMLVLKCRNCCRKLRIILELWQHNWLQFLDPNISNKKKTPLFGAYSTHNIALRSDLILVWVCVFVWGGGEATDIDTKLQYIFLYNSHLFLRRSPPSQPRSFIQHSNQFSFK